MRLHRLLIAIASVFVPKASRAEWRAEWEAELQHREARDRDWPEQPGRHHDLVRRSAGAFWDALWLQSHRWYTLRLFGRHWRLALAAALSLTVAMAATVVGIAGYNAVLVRLPGVGDPRTLQLIHVRTADDAFAPVSYPEFEEYRGRVSAFSDVTAYPFEIQFSAATIAGDRHEQVVHTRVADNFFQVLGITPRLGRLDLTSPPADGIKRAVISEKFWHSLGSDPALVGGRIVIGDEPYLISGVVPVAFGGMTWGFSPDLWLSLKANSPPEALANRGQLTLHMVGRLRPGVTALQALADAQLASRTIARDHPDADQNRLAILTPLSITPPGDRAWTQRIFASLLFVVLLSLVVACANVVNLLLGLAGSRRHEMIVRAALGASRLQLVAPLLRESLMVGVVSGLIGYGVAAVALTKLSAWRPAFGMFPPPSFDVRPDIWVFAATFGLSMAVGLGVGLVPALRAAAEGLSGSLQREHSGGGLARTRVRNVLVVIQMAIATVVLAAVGVSIHSFFKLQHLPLGFSSRHLLYTSFNLERGRYDARTGPSMYARIREKVAAEPGISAVTIATDAPIMGYGNSRVVADVETPPPDGRGVETPCVSVDDHYASALGLTLLAGRFFDARDVPGRTETVVINQTMARKYWGSESAVGHHLRGGDQGHQFEVIGVVADGKYGDVDEPPLSFMYFPLAQHYQPDIVVIAQTTGPREAVAELVADLDPRLVASGFGMVTLEDMLAVSMLLSRVLLMATMTFAIIALGLAVFGLYSTVFYAVNQRRTEIGIRVALGARRGHLFRMVLRQTGYVALAGAGAGLVAAAVLLPAAASLFFGIEGAEPGVLALVALASASVTLATTYFVIRPWTRASALDLMRGRT